MKKMCELIHGRHAMAMRGQQGFTMLELLLVLAAIGVLVAAAWMLLGTKADSAKIVAAEDQVMKMYATCLEWKLRTGTNSYTGIDMNALAATIPGFSAGMENPWGVASGYQVAPNGSGVDITVVSVPAVDQTALQQRFSKKGYTAIISGSNVVVTMN